MKMVKTNHLKIVIFTAVKNRCILHGHVFIMLTVCCEVTQDLCALLAVEFSFILFIFEKNHS